MYLVPTATMADHLRNSLVRSGVAVRPRSIQTLAAFLDLWAPLAKTPDAVVHLAMEQALQRVPPKRFSEVAEFPGVVRALVGLFAEVSGKKLPDDVGKLFAAVERDLEMRGFAPRHARLKGAAKRIAQGGEVLPGRVFFDGFFKFSAGELALIAALTRRSDVTIALHDWSGAERARETLLAGGFAEQRVERSASPTPVVVRALNIEREVEEIASRILDEVAHGRAFREIGIVLRSRDPYGPLLETTLARFGIPYRAYFTDPLASHPHIQFLSQICRAALQGWDREVLLPALRSPASGLGGTKAGDELDFRLREGLPAHGWPQTAGLNTQDRLEPAEWAARLTALQSWSPECWVTDRAGYDRVLAWRSTSAARQGWDEAMQSAAVALEGSGRVSLTEFWKHAETVLQLESLRVPDARRNVVHLLDAYEARQWSLPVVFVCGLTERHFPKYHAQDPIVGNEALRRAGLDTAEDRELEERFLYELAITRGTVHTILSYPHYDQAGQETLPSFFLQGQKELDSNLRVRPAPVRSIAPPRPAPIQDEVLVARLGKQFPHLSASSIEKYLQCPFQFFVQKTLGAKARPKAPRDRLDALLQGSILHEALAEWTRRPFLDTAALDGAFETECDKKRVPATYRAEAVRLELLRHFERFTRDTQVQLNWESQVEESFEFTLREGITLKGRIDRLDLAGDGRALVIDYKYSAADKVKAKVADSESGDLVQAGVYLLAAEKAGYQPAGMLFCAVKKGVHWDGWHSSIEGLEEIGERRTAAGIVELAREAEQTVLRVYDEITHGRIAIQPKDPSKCVWCDCRDICRVESIAQAKELSA